jgi:hypothetical protein
VQPNVVSAEPSFASARALFGNCDDVVAVRRRFWFCERNVPSKLTTGMYATLSVQRVERTRKLRPRRTSIPARTRCSRRARRHAGCRGRERRLRQRPDLAQASARARRVRNRPLGVGAERATAGRPERSIAEPDVTRPPGELRNLLTKEVARARRSRRPLSVLLIEAAGGERTISFETYRGPIEAQLRAIDLVARINGTVGVLLPYTSELDGRTVAERIRLSVPPQLRSDVTLSIGIAEFPRDWTRADELLELAERALSHAKERGGNRTICTSLDPGAPPGWTLTRELSPS